MPREELTDEELAGFCQIVAEKLNIPLETVTERYKSAATKLITHRKLLGRNIPEDMKLTEDEKDIFWKISCFKFSY
ncbi:MAG: hypothetical protein COY40_04590 [Alphaproteobacteria bacterium CG_4_10_14_0_8_um_filter_53_9]|nr:MAG: hypothetical protein COY40_04590 [Alphaproteobacteria bacterium CG_4_10_14_0_8_um_filter_53_9]